jgi:hypothetical protein
MPRSAALARDLSREEARCLEFDAALADYIAGGDAEELLCAAILVVGNFGPIDPIRADAIAELTACSWEVTDYDDAGRAVWRWFAQMQEPGARH